MSQKYWKTIGFIVILGGLLSACGASAGSQATPTPLPPLVSYQAGLFTVEQGSIVSEKDLLGEIVPARQDQLYFQSSGFITRLTVKRGDLVKAGEVLAELQIDDLLAQLQQAQIDLDVAKADLERNHIQHDFDVKRAEAEVTIWEKRLELAALDVERSFGTAKDAALLNYDITTQNLMMAQESLALVVQSSNPYAEQVVRRNELTVQRLEALLSERQIVAPYDCVVLRVNIRPGQSVEAYANAIDVGDPTELVVRAQFDFGLRDKLFKTTETNLFFTTEEGAQGYPVTFLPNFLPITQTESPTASFLPTADFFYFEITESTPSEELTVGRSVFLTVILGRKEDALLLPPAAIREYKGLYFVIVQDGEIRRRVEINEIGLQATDRWEIVADLQPGSQVVGP
jgi:HlyD family secretion protein